MNTNKAGSDATLIFGISRHRLTTDGEGVTTLVAFNGCPLRCKYCLNKASWEPDKGRLYTPETLFEEVKIDQLYFLATKGGITFGGGEPLLQVEFIKTFRALCGSQWQILAETSLNVPFENIQALDTVLDGYIIDIKDMNPEIYQAYTGKDNAIVLANLEWLLKKGDPNRIIVRVPHIPEFNTDEDVMRSMEQLKKMGVKHIDEFNYLIR
jgi:pyruvate formate lyase activating enzyme